MCQGWGSIYRSSTSFPNPQILVAVKKSGCLFRGSVLMQMHAGICWQWKNRPLMLAWWAVLGKKGRARRLDSPVQAATAHTLCSSPRESMVISPLVIVSPPPRSQLKFVAEMSTNGHPPVLRSCISVIWCEKKATCSLFSFCLWGFILTFQSHCALLQTGVLETFYTSKTHVKISSRHHNLLW